MPGSDKKYFRVVTIGMGGGTKTGEFLEKFQRGGGHLQSKNLYCRFWTFIQGFKQGFSESFQKWGGGSKLFGIFPKIDPFWYRHPSISFWEKARKYLLPNKTFS